jgi:uracil-DNA glycosylase family 4
LGANRTGRAFEGDRSSETLWAAIAAAGIGRDQVAITNALKCFPPENKPTTTELSTCASRFLRRELAESPVWLALGKLAHEAILRTQGRGLSAHPFTHGAQHRLGDAVLVDCYHPSPRNVATGRLRPGMLEAVLRTAHQLGH